MKSLAIFAIGSMLAVAAPGASADLISFDGTDTYNSTTGSIDFLSMRVEGDSTGVFAPFTPGSTVTFDDFNYINFTPGTLLTATAPNGEQVTFDMSTESSAYEGPILDIWGTGTYTFTNPTGAATGSYGLNTQFGGNGTDVVTFSDSNVTSVTPEPSSLILLGTGLVGAAGILFRRRRTS